MNARTNTKKNEHEPVRYPLKVQGIRRRGRTPTLYVYFPLPLAAAIGMEAGETVQWELLDRRELRLVRALDVTAPAPRRP
jgi:hypothetical protein